MDLSEFILKITENHSIEFECDNDRFLVGYRFTVTRLTKESRLYRIKLAITTEALEDMKRYGQTRGSNYTIILLS